jgi:hypothetical protein
LRIPITTLAGLIRAAIADLAYVPSIPLIENQREPCAANART